MQVSRRDDWANQARPQEAMDLYWDQRREARLNSNAEEYRRLNGVRNAAIRRDREKFWDEQATLLETAALHNDQRQVFNLLRRAKAGPQVWSWAQTISIQPQKCYTNE